MMDKRLKYKSSHHKSPRGEHREEKLRFPHSNIFVNMSLRARGIKERTNKWDKNKKLLADERKHQQNGKGNNHLGKYICK